MTAMQIRMGERRDYHPLVFLRGQPHLCPESDALNAPAGRQSKQRNRGST